MAAILELRCVDNGMLFDAEEAIEAWIRYCKADILVKGSDWEGKPITGAHLVKQVVYIPHTGESTTEILERLRA